jgi:hypothetical protein
MLSVAQTVASNCQALWQNCEKATISFVMPVRPSVRPSVCPHEKNSAPKSPFLMKFGIREFLKTLTGNFKFY